MKGTCHKKGKGWIVKYTKKERRGFTPYWYENIECELPLYGDELKSHKEGDEIIFLEHEDHATIFETVKEKLTVVSKNTLERYENDRPVKEILNRIKKDLDKVCNKFLKDNVVRETDFPIEVENEMGKWKIEADGKCMLQPKAGIQYIEIDFTVTPTGFKDNKK